MKKLKKKNSSKRLLAYWILLGLVILLTSNRTTSTNRNGDLTNPLLFVLVPPPLSTGSTFGHQLETFGNHLTSMRVAPRGGDLCLLDVDGNIRFLTKEAGFGIESGEIQTENGIAVRQPCVHWDGNRALFSMVVGGPTKAYDQSYRANRWQIYEITNLDEVVNGQVANIVKIENQPEYNNISPIYGSDDQIIFTSDAPLFDMDHTYPQLDEYESSATNTGIFKLNPSTGEVIHLTHSPSGDFDIHLAKDGRVISTRWEHLKRDQQADSHRAGVVPWAPVNYDSERSDAEIINGPAEKDGKPYADADGTPWEIFPEARVEEDPTRDPNEPLHDFNEFLPWEITEFGERHQTMNHVGRHEFGGVFQHGSKIDDPNLIYTLGDFSKNAFRETVGSDAGIFQIKEDPRPGMEGTFYGAWSREFSRMSSGRIFQFALPIGANPQDMEIIDWTHPDIDNVSNEKGHFRNPIMTMDGTMVVSYTSESGLYNRDNPYHFQIAKMVPASNSSNATEHIAQVLTGTGIEREILYWGDFTTPVSETVLLNEVDVVEIVPRTRATSRPIHEIAAVEKEVLDEEAIDENALRAWMIENDLALIAIRNATERDQGEQQQPFNLRVPGGVETIPADGKVYDISHLQIFQADMIRAYRFRDLQGRRILAQPLHNSEANPNVAEANLLDENGPVGSVKIGLDGSIAAFIPATRAMSWQTVSPTGEPIVRERQWLTFAPGEIRTCEGCHGINDKAHSGNGIPTNKPDALRDLMRHWKINYGGGIVSGLDDGTASRSNGLVLYQNYPNPFGQFTTIQYDLPTGGQTAINIYNSTGQVVRSLINKKQVGGHHTIAWDRRNDHGGMVGPGIYICELTINEHSVMNKIVVN